MAPQTIPPPLIVPPTGVFDNYFGTFSSWSLSIGTPPQDVHIRISTSSSIAVVDASISCGRQSSANCTSTGGGKSFYNALSSSWKNDSTAVNILPVNRIWDYGLFSYSLGRETFHLPSSTAITDDKLQLKDHFVALCNVERSNMGGIGISANPFNNSGKLVPSLLQTLKSRFAIPSLSWGFSAGAYYKVSDYGSLTFGGYDKSRYVPNNITFPFNSEPDREFMMDLYSVTWSDLNSIGNVMLNSTIRTRIDSSLYSVGLPSDVADNFASTFGLSWLDEWNTLSISESRHAALSTRNLSFTFTIGAKRSKTDITIPFVGFDMSVFFTGSTELSRIFPVVKTNSSQYHLGLTFLQEAYLIADWERRQFSLSAVPKTYKAPEILTISPVTPAEPLPEDRHGLSAKAKAGIAVGAIVFLLTVLLLFRRTALYKSKVRPKVRNILRRLGIGAGVSKRAELDGDKKEVHEMPHEKEAPTELEGGQKAFHEPEQPEDIEKLGSTREVYELPDTPMPRELSAEEYHSRSPEIEPPAYETPTVTTFSSRYLSRRDTDVTLTPADENSWRPNDDTEGISISSERRSSNLVRALPPDEKRRLSCSKSVPTSKGDKAEEVEGEDSS